MNRYGHLNVFVRYEHHRTNWQRLYSSPGLTILQMRKQTGEDGELPKITSGSAMTRARSPASRPGSFHATVLAHQTYSLMEFLKSLAPVTPWIFLL